MASNALEDAKKGWVRSEIERALAEQPQKLYASVKASAVENGKGRMAWIMGGITVCLFITGSIYAGLLAKDLEAAEGSANTDNINLRQKKMGRLVITGFTTAIGFITLAITIGLLVYTEAVFLQNQNRIALGIAFFALFISSLIYTIAVRTRSFNTSTS